MGCLSWLFRKKKNNRKRKRGRKGSEKHGCTPCAEKELPGLKITKGGIAFQIDFKPARTAHPMRHKFVNSLETAMERKVLVNVRRLEKMVRRGEASQEADRKRDVFHEKKAEQEQPFVMKSRQGIVNIVLPDQERIAANMKFLAKRCKRERIKRRVAALFKLGDGDRRRRFYFI